MCLEMNYQLYLHENNENAKKQFQFVQVDPDITVDICSMKGFLGMFEIN